MNFSKGYKSNSELTLSDKLNYFRVKWNQLFKQAFVNNMHRRLVTVEWRKPAAKAKARKTSSRGLKKKTSQTKIRR